MLANGTADDDAGPLGLEGHIVASGAGGLYPSDECRRMAGHGYVRTQDSFLLKANHYTEIDIDWSENFLA